jgi:hypothetical protein
VGVAWAPLCSLSSLQQQLACSPDIASRSAAPCRRNAHTITLDSPHHALRVHLPCILNKCTGGSSGAAKEVIKDLAARGATVYAGCRCVHCVSVCLCTLCLALCIPGSWRLVQGGGTTCACAAATHVRRKQ